MYKLLIYTVFANYLLFEQRNTQCSSTTASVNELKCWIDCTTFFKISPTIDSADKTASLKFVKNVNPHALQNNPKNTTEISDTF